VGNAQRGPNDTRTPTKEDIVSQPNYPLPYQQIPRKAISKQRKRTSHSLHLVHYR
jgi:hypothetical protein